MKKRYKLTDLDCANCAAKMEAAIKKIDGVHDATVSFMAQKMTVDADDARFDDIMRVQKGGARLRHQPVRPRARPPAGPFYIFLSEALL